MAYWRALHRRLKFVCSTVEGYCTKKMMTLAWRKVWPLAAILVLVTAFRVTRAHNAPSPNTPSELRQEVSVPFRFVAFGDTRFTHSSSSRVANSEIRQAIVRAIAKIKPSFISIGGDIVYRGDDANDWAVWDSETSAWREEKITIYPALGSHDLHGNEATALSNYFKRFPDISGSRYYSVRLANCLMLVLDSSLGETKGSQGAWINQKLQSLPGDVAFVLIVLHHPAYTSSSDEERYGGGHSARSDEKEFATVLEEHQLHTRARFVVFSGHVHNYERHQHGGVTYFVTGGGGAHAYPIERSRSDLFQSTTVNYHYLLAEVSAESMKITMNRVEMNDGKEIWTQPDTVTITVPPKQADGSKPSLETSSRAPGFHGAQSFDRQRGAELRRKSGVACGGISLEGALTCTGAHCCIMSSLATNLSLRVSWEASFRSAGPRDFPPPVPRDLRATFSSVASDPAIGSSNTIPSAWPR